ncbi:unnamed protein product [Nippostrongylus brasiliensis]|uniref:Putative serine/threonine-protein kinase (inferred by orthology to a C. elegans protein) n=1 Tax=Nippostrongylus brasiliensis TaxID=27835 RepID=A0A158R120_NIPBR|nr:unnamed protein product [Nippostrongylus brasiliensis]
MAGLSTAVDSQTIHCLVLDYFPDDVAKLREKGVRFDQLDAMEGILKLADFGNAVRFGTLAASPYQVTRYYRPPELLFGSVVITPAIDVWSAGCVTYDFITSRPLFKGHNSDEQVSFAEGSLRLRVVHQVKIIVEVLGYPSAEEVKAMAANRPRVRRMTGRGLDKYVGANFDPKALALLQGVLIYDPSKRRTAEQVLKHDYFEPLRQVRRQWLNRRSVHILY